MSKKLNYYDYWGNPVDKKPSDFNLYIEVARSNLPNKYSVITTNRRSTVKKEYIPTDETKYKENEDRYFPYPFVTNIYTNTKFGTKIKKFGAHTLEEALQNHAKCVIRYSKAQCVLDSWQLARVR